MTHWRILRDYGSRAQNIRVTPGNTTIAHEGGRRGHPSSRRIVRAVFFVVSQKSGAGAASTLSRWRQAALSPGDFSVRSAGFHTRAYLATENRGVIMMNNTSAMKFRFFFWGGGVSQFSFSKRLSNSKFPCEIAVIYKSFCLHFYFKHNKCL